MYTANDMYNRRTNKLTGWTLLTLLVSNGIIMTLAYPQGTHQLAQYHQQIDQQTQQQSSLSSSSSINQNLSPVYRPSYSAQSENNRLNEGRKFAVKPNASKKVALDDIDEDTSINNNNIEETPGFSWTNVISTFFHLIFNGGKTAPYKTDDLDNNGGFSTSPWANFISVGLKIITTLLGGGAPNDGIDKIDNGGSPMQNILAAILSTLLGTKDPQQVNMMAKQADEFITIVMNLLDALKTSFSHRSMAARSLGKRDSVSDAAVAGISMLKSYVKTYRSTDDKCMQKYLCEANSECVSEIGGTSIFCQLGTYATSFIIEKTSGNRFESLYDAGRRGRSGENCRQIYLECNEV